MRTNYPEAMCRTACLRLLRFMTLCDLTLALTFMSMTFAFMHAYFLVIPISTQGDFEPFSALHNPRPTGVFRIPPNAVMHSDANDGQN